MERSLGVLDVVTAETISKFKVQDHAGLDTALSALGGHIVESFIEWSRRMMLQRCAMELQSEAGAAEACYCRGREEAAGGRGVKESGSSPSSPSGTPAP